MSLDLDFKHILISAKLANPPTTPEVMNRWLLDVVAAVNMKVLIEPTSVRCETIGNVGVTGIVGIETSHSTAHCWEDRGTPFIEFDLFSCMPFSSDVVLETLQQFDPYSARLLVVDRNVDKNNGFLIIENRQVIYKECLSG